MDQATKQTSWLHRTWQEAERNKLIAALAGRWTIGCTWLEVALVLIRLMLPSLTSAAGMQRGLRTKIWAPARVCWLAHRQDPGSGGSSCLEKFLVLCGGCDDNHRFHLDLVSMLASEARQHQHAGKLFGCCSSTHPKNWLPGVQPARELAPSRLKCWYTTFYLVRLWKV